MLQDIETYEQTQETLALLKLLAISKQQEVDGKVKPARAVIAKLRAKNK